MRNNANGHVERTTTVLSIEHIEAKEKLARLRNIHLEMFSDHKGHCRLGTDSANESAPACCIYRVGQEQIFPGASLAFRPACSSSARARTTATLSTDDQGVPLFYRNLAVCPFSSAFDHNVTPRRGSRVCRPDSLLLAREHTSRPQNRQG
jgi:hypothetical protein